MGRSPYCSIVLSNSQSSRQHCALRLDGEALTVSDLDSANGTWVNDVRVTAPRQLEAGDIIRVGTDVLEVLPTQGMNGERGRPTTHTSAATGDDDKSPNTSVVDDVPHTQTAAGQLELVEALVASASEARRPLALAPMIQRAIEGLIVQHGRKDSPSPTSAATRLSALIEIVTSWSPDEFADWRRNTLATIDNYTSERLLEVAPRVSFDQ